MVIRRANLGDVDELLQLIANEASHFPPVPTREKVTEKVLRNEIVFFMGVMIIMTQYKSSQDQGQYAYQGPSVYLSHIASRTKGQGLGTKVLTAFLIENRHRHVFLNVFADNAAARKAYEKAGMKLQGIHLYHGREVARYHRPRSAQI